MTDKRGLQYKLWVVQSRRFVVVQVLLIGPVDVLARPAVRDIGGVFGLPEGPGHRFAAAEFHGHEAVFPVPDDRFVIDQPVVADVSFRQDEFVMLLIEDEGLDGQLFPFFEGIGRIGHTHAFGDADRREGTRGQEHVSLWDHLLTLFGADRAASLGLYFVIFKFGIFQQAAQIGHLRVLRAEEEVKAGKDLAEEFVQFFRIVGLGFLHQLIVEHHVLFTDAAVFFAAVEKLERAAFVVGILGVFVVEGSGGFDELLRGFCPGFGLFGKGIGADIGVHEGAAQFVVDLLGVAEVLAEGAVFGDGGNAEGFGFFEFGRGFVVLLSLIPDCSFHFV